MNCQLTLNVENSEVDFSHNFNCLEKDILGTDISSSVECNMPVTLGVYRRDKLIGAAIETTRGR